MGEEGSENRFGGAYRVLKFYVEVHVIDEGVK
jgi:hypothetical protein